MKTEMPKRLTRAGKRANAARTPGPQKVTRVPPFRPGTWVKLKEFDPREPGGDLSGKVRRVRSLTCSITSAEQRYAIWRVHFDDGRCLEWGRVEREATEAEVVRVMGRASR